MNTNNISISDAIKIGVLSGQYPRYVYKYRPINIFTENIFKDSSLWFANPKSFNDPFDCQIVTNTENTFEEIIAFLNQNDMVSSNEAKRLLAEDWCRRPQDWHATINSSINTIINQTALCCFAGSNDNILMWSHYADSHKGICLKFDLLADLDFFEIPIIVKYSDEYPFYNHLKDSSKIFEALFQTKAKCWDYENELRVYKPQGPSKGYKFAKKSLIEICFGFNISVEAIARIKELLKEYNFEHIKLKKAKTSTSSFKIQVEDFS